MTHSSFLPPCVTLLMIAVCPGDESKLRVLIIDGHAGFHGVHEATAVFQTMLLQSGRFHVEVSVPPSLDGDEQSWLEWRPRFSRFDVVVLNSFGDKRPPDLLNEFAKYTRNGGGLVVYHMTVGSG